MSRVERDPERGRAVAAELKKLGVTGVLIQAAEQGYITELACQMPKCFCPEELGGARYFEEVTDELSDWMPTHEHFPRSKREGSTTPSWRTASAIASTTPSRLAVRTRKISRGSRKPARKRSAAERKIVVALWTKSGSGGRGCWLRQGFADVTTVQAVLYRERTLSITLDRSSSTYV
jgi:hypothetical protein